MNTQPPKFEGARICVLRHADEIVIYSNKQGFRALGLWMAWLAESREEELFHFHLLWHLESDASRFEGMKPKGDSSGFGINS